MSDRSTFFYRISIPGSLARVSGTLALLAAASGCATIPEPKFHQYTFPKNAYVGDVQRPYTILGPVRSKVDYQTLDPNHEEKDLCHNYYNKAVRDLVKYAKKQGADAVVDVKSVVFLVDGRTESYPTPECSDDGGDGQVLTQGVAVKWKGGPVENGAWTTPSKIPAPATHVISTPIAVASPATKTPATLPALQPGAQFARDPGEPAIQIGPSSEEDTVEPPSASASAAKAAAAPSSNTPVTMQMENYDSNKNQDSPPRQPAAVAEPAQAAQPAPDYVPPPAPTTSAASSGLSSGRASLADPRGPALLRP